VSAEFGKKIMNYPEKSPSGDTPRFFYGWYMVAASWVLIFLTNAVAIGIFFKPILEDLQLDRATLSLVQSVALIAYAIASPFLGRFIDRYGPRVMLAICIGTQVLSRALNGAATHVWHLATARLLFEVKALPATQVMTNRWFIKKRGTAQGILASGMPVGMLVLAPISQYLILLWGWRPTMFFWAAVTLAIMVPLVLLMRNNPEDKGYSPDGETLDRVQQTDLPQANSAAIIKPPAYGGFSEVAKIPSLWLLTMTHFICGVGCGFMTTHIVIFATDVGFSDMIAATLLSVQGGLNVIGVLVTGHLGDRFARKQVLALTHFIRSLSFATIVVFILMGSGSLWMLYLAMAFFGFGWFTTAPLTAGLVADLFGSSLMGTILGVTTSAHIFGVALGAYAGGAVFDITGSYEWIFLVQTLLAWLAVILALAIKKKSSP